MFRHRRGSSATQTSGEASVHNDRPWVYFMVDCFFLVTQFYVATFHVKCEEKVLPQHLPAGGTHDPKVVRTVDETLYVRVFNEAGRARYQIQDSTVSAEMLSERLASVARAFTGNVIVRVSYDGDVQWSDVMAVFNSCTKANIKKCGLIPLRSDKAALER